MSERPLIALLANRWESKTEEGWTTRQVAGALACAADVHVITPQGDTPIQRIDSVFTMHEMATPSGTAAEIRRDLLIEAISETGSGMTGRLLPEFGRLLDRDLMECWDGASDLISGLHPDMVVIAGHQLVGALDAVDRVAPELPVVLLALGSDLASLSFPHFDRVFDRAQAVLAITETERLAIIEHHPGATGCTGSAPRWPPTPAPSTSPTPGSERPTTSSSSPAPRPKATRKPWPSPG